MPCTAPPSYERFKLLPKRGRRSCPALRLAFMLPALA